MQCKGVHFMLWAQTGGSVLLTGYSGVNTNTISDCHTLTKVLIKKNATIQNCPIFHSQYSFTFHPQEIEEVFELHGRNGRSTIPKCIINYYSVFRTIFILNLYIGKSWKLKEIEIETFIFISTVRSQGSLQTCPNFTDPWGNVSPFLFRRQNVRVL